MPELDYKVVKLNEKSQVLIDMRQNEEEKDHASDGGQVKYDKKSTIREKKK